MHAAVSERAARTVPDSAIRALFIAVTGFFMFDDPDRVVGTTGPMGANE